MKIKIAFFSFLFLLSGQLIYSQNYNLLPSRSEIKVEGTSNLHDWDIISKAQTGNIEAVFNDGKLTEIKSLIVELNTESLKSGKSGMDKNTYKALKSDKFKKISFKLNKVNSINRASSGTYSVSVNGNLTIAGESRPVTIQLTLKADGNTIAITGNHKLLMTDFKVDPPKALMGTITTGNEVTIIFNSNFSK